jgi:hypothetical protein
VAALNLELDYLRATYSNPYWAWRDYLPYYPSSLLYPYSSLYAPSLYPYTYLSSETYPWWI